MIVECIEDVMRIMGLETAKSVVWLFTQNVDQDTLDLDAIFADLINQDVVTLDLDQTLIYPVLRKS